MNPKATFLFLLCIGTLLAGCTEDQAPKGNRLGDAQFSSTTGGIRGLVLDENQLPVADARVALADGADIAGFTDEDGIFVINFVPPGEHVLFASADGYLPQEIAVTVAAGELTDEVLVTLVVSPSDAPYTLTEIHRRTISGFTFKLTPDCMYLRDAPGASNLQGTPVYGPLNTTKTCTGSTFPVIGCSGAQAGEGCSSWDFNSTLTNNSDWRTILMEGYWVSTSAVTGKSFYIDLAAPGYRTGSYVFTDPEVWYDMGNTPPVLIRADNPDELIERGLPPEKWCCKWIARLFPAQCDLGNCFERTGPDIGLMIEQSIELYYTFGIHEALPEDYSAKPLE